MHIESGKTPVRLFFEREKKIVVERLLPMSFGMEEVKLLLEKSI